jgi:hypothetical protein
LYAKQIFSKEKKQMEYATAGGIPVTTPLNYPTTNEKKPSSYRVRTESEKRNVNGVNV